MSGRIYSLLVEEDNITWKDILMELVRSEEMNPWDINVSEITKKYMEVIKSLKEADFKVSGKVLLAAAYMLKVKSNLLVGKELGELDRLLASREEMSSDEFYEDLESNYDMRRDPSQISEREKMTLIPKTPQARLRKVSIFDLVNALEKALEVKKRRLMRRMPNLEIDLPEQKRDITLMIKKTYKGILDFILNAKGKLTFSSLVGQEPSREDKIYTFIPLLHLTTERKIDLEQSEQFGDINIKLLAK